MLMWTGPLPSSKNLNLSILGGEVMKFIVCPSCGEEIVIKDLYEGVEVQCELCGSVLLYEEGKFILLDTNEEFDPEDLEKDFSEGEEKLEDEFDEIDYSNFYEG